MYRLFSDFPLGLPGIGLLILRIVLAFALADEHVRMLVGPAVVTVRSAYGVTVIGLSLLVAVGFLTPVVHTAVALVESISFALGVHQVGLAVLTNGQWEAPVLKIVIALALLLIGPGGYSIDGRLFGRKTFVIRPPERPARAGRRSSVFFPPRK